jgi:hypothetical protein
MAAQRERYFENDPRLILKLNREDEDSGGGGGGGSVTSVGLSMPAEFTVSGSPVVAAGTLTAAKATQTANTVWAGPTSGAAAAPTFRALTPPDLPPYQNARHYIYALPQWSSTTQFLVGMQALGNATIVSYGAPTATNRISQALRQTIETPATFAVGHVRANGTAGAIWWRGNAAGMGGFSFRIIVGTDTVVSTMKWGAMLRALLTAPTTATVPSNSVDCIGVGTDEGDTNLYVLHNDAAGTCTKVDTGMSAKTADDIFVIDITCTPNGSDMTVSVTRSGGTNFTTTVSSNLPTNTVFMGPIAWMSNGTSGSPGVAGLAWMGFGGDQPSYFV